MKKNDAEAEAAALIERIRREVQNRKGRAEESGGASAPLRRAAAALNRVKAKDEATGKWPRLLRPLRRNQQAVNAGLAEALEQLVVEGRSLRETVDALESRESPAGSQAPISELRARVARLEEALRALEARLHTAS